MDYHATGYQEFKRMRKIICLHYEPLIIEAVNGLTKCADWEFAYWTQQQNLLLREWEGALDRLEDGA